MRNWRSSLLETRARKNGCGNPRHVPGQGQVHHV